MFFSNWNVESIVLYDTWKLNEGRISGCIFICLHVVCVCFLATVPEWNTCSRDHMPWKTQNYYSLAFNREIFACQPQIYSSVSQSVACGLLGSIHGIYKIKLMIVITKVFHFPLCWCLRGWCGSHDGLNCSCLTKSWSSSSRTVLAGWVLQCHMSLVN